MLSPLLAIVLAWNPADGPVRYRVWQDGKPVQETYDVRATVEVSSSGSTFWVTAVTDQDVESGPSLPIVAAGYPSVAVSQSGDDAVLTVTGCVGQTAVIQRTSGAVWQDLWTVTIPCVVRDQGAILNRSALYRAVAKVQVSP